MNDGGNFEWDENKAEGNLDKHGITFSEAVTIFVDPNHIVEDDGEDNLSVIGMSAFARVLLVVAVERTDKVRIISARKATRDERRRYNEGW